MGIGREWYSMILGMLLTLKILQRKKKYFISEKFTSCYNKINCDGMRGEAQDALILLQTSRYLLKYNFDELLLKIVLMQVINLTVLSKSGSPPTDIDFDCLH